MAVQKEHYFCLNHSLPAGNPKINLRTMFRTLKLLRVEREDKMSDKECKFYYKRDLQNSKFDPNVCKTAFYMNYIESAIDLSTCVGFE